MPRTRASVVRTCDDCHSNESIHEREIQQHKQSAQSSRSSSFLEQRHEHYDKSIESSSGKNAFNGVIGFRNATIGLEAVDQTKHFVNSRGEDVERHNEEEKLKDARETQKSAIKNRVLERFRNEAREELSVSIRDSEMSNDVRVIAGHYDEGVVGEAIQIGSDKNK